MEKVLRFLAGVYDDSGRMDVVAINGGPALRVVRNPHKLARLDAPRVLTR